MAASPRRTILHLDSGRELRGGQWQVVRLMRGLRKRGYDNLLLARANSPLIEQCRRENFKCDSIGISSLRWAAKLAHVIHAHDARSHALAAFWVSLPLLVSRRVTFPIKRNPLSAWKYRKARLYLAVSNVVAAELRAAQVPDEKIRVVYDGVPILNDRWSPKGPVLIPRFSDQRKGNRLPLEAARLANAPVVRSTKLEADLNGASMLVYLTDSEGLGSAALLAMSAGVPVIASDIGGLREAVQHGETGLLVPNELEAVTAAIRSLRDAPDYARTLSLNARQAVIDRFSEDRMVTETLSLYETLFDA